MSCSEWKEYRLEEIGEIVSGGTPSTKNEEYYGNEISWITPKDLSGYNSKYISKGERSITKLGLEKSSAKLLPKGTILFSSRAPIGYVAISQQEMCTNQGFKNIICNPQIANNEFIYYRMKLAKEELESIAGGSTFKEVSGKIMKEFKVKLPALDDQEKIANILSSLDDKIELNNEMNKTLEEMAQSIFKRWFVEFEFPNEDGEPYKSSGGEMTESELGMIPRGWKVKTIGDIGEVISGGTPSTKNEEYYGGDISWITPKDLSGYDRKFISKGERSITELGLQKSSAKLLPKGTVLFSSRAPIGYVAISQQDVCTNQGFKSIVCNNEIMNNNYVYYFLKFNKENIENISSGSTFKEISGTHMKNFKIIVPSKDILDNFNRMIISYDELLIKNYEEIDSLIEIKNIILPKLMGGEII